MEGSRSSRNISFLKQCGFPQFLFMRLLGVYFLLSDITIFYSYARGISPLKKWTEFIGCFPLPAMIALYVLLFAGVSLLFYLMPKKFRTFTECFDPVLLIASVLVFSCTLVFRSDDFSLSVFIGLFSLILVIYGSSRIHPETLNRERSGVYTAVPVAVLAACVLGFVCVTAVAIHRCFDTSTFDLGIFTQMFHSMKKNLSAVTTCERGYFLSHFRVHSSFILYLLMPVYALFPSAETLIVSQAALVTSGVIPLYLIAKKRGFAGVSLLSACMVYLFSLGLLSPSYFHFHENAFLPAILMWLLFAVEYKKIILFYVMSFLLLMVKEDAAVFLICICLYLAFEEKGKDRRRALITGGAALLYFLLITSFLSGTGDSEAIAAMRMNTLMTSEDQGVLQILKNVLIHPGRLLTVFSRREESLLILLEMLFPLLFTPFFTRKTHRFFLMVPFLLFNLVFGASYIYASQITFHYAYGPATLLIYMAIVNISEFEKDRKHSLVLACAVVSVISAFAMVSGNLRNCEKYEKNKDRYQRIENCLEKIPQDAGVSCDTHFLPHIAGREEIYPIDSAQFGYQGEHVVKLTGVEETEFVVLNLMDGPQVQARDMLLNGGYEVYAEEQELIVVLKSSH